MKPFTSVAVLVFTLVAIVQLLRVALGWDVSINGVIFPPGRASLFAWLRRRSRSCFGGKDERESVAADATDALSRPPGFIAEARKDGSLRRRQRQASGIYLKQGRRHADYNVQQFHGWPGCPGEESWPFRCEPRCSRSAPLGSLRRGRVDPAVLLQRTSGGSAPY